MIRVFDTCATFEGLPDVVAMMADGVIWATVTAEPGGTLAMSARFMVSAPIAETLAEYLFEEMLVDAGAHAPYLMHLDRQHDVEEHAAELAARMWAVARGVS